MVRTKMNWSGPNRDFLPKWFTIGPNQFILVVTISFWSWLNHYGQVQINLVRQKPFWTDLNNFSHICLVLLCDQNSLGRSKMDLVWPNWFGLHHNDLVTTKVKWSRPKWIGQVQMGFILVENHNLDLTNSFWLWPFHFGPTKTVLVT